MRTSERASNDELWSYRTAESSDPDSNRSSYRYHSLFSGATKRRQRGDSGGDEAVRRQRDGQPQGGTSEQHGALVGRVTRPVDCEAALRHDP